MSQALFLNTWEIGLNKTDKVPALRKLILEEKIDDKQTVIGKIQKECWNTITWKRYLIYRMTK